MNPRKDFGVPKGTIEVVVKKCESKRFATRLNLEGRKRRCELIVVLGNFCLESLILAQNERWRHGLGMQVERSSNA